MKIAEVCERFSITPDTLRYYERIGLIPRVNRNNNGIRDYSETELKRVEFIKCMRNAGLSIEVLTEYIGLLQQGDSTVEARKRLLTEQRELLITRMKEMQETLNLLDYKIRLYEDIIIKHEEDLIMETT